MLGDFRKISSKNTTSTHSDKSGQHYRMHKVKRNWVFIGLFSVIIFGFNGVSVKADAMANNASSSSSNASTILSSSNKSKSIQTTKNVDKTKATRVLSTKSEKKDSAQRVGNREQVTVKIFCYKAYDQKPVTVNDLQFTTNNDVSIDTSSLTNDDFLIDGQANNWPTEPAAGGALNTFEIVITSVGLAKLQAANPELEILDVAGTIMVGSVQGQEVHGYMVDDDDNETKVGTSGNWYNLIYLEELSYDFTNEIPDGYELAAGQSAKGTTIVGYETDDDNIYIHLVHKHTVVKDAATTMNTVKYNGAGNKTPQTSLTNILWTSDTDEVTGNVSWTANSPVTEIASPNVPGYTADKSTVSFKNVSADNVAPKNQSATVSYEVKNVDYTLTLVDNDGNRIPNTSSTKITGKAGETITDIPSIPGYTVVSGQRLIVPNESGNNVNVKYTANDQSTNIQYVDDDSKSAQVGKLTPLNGKTDQTVDWTAKVPAGYQLANGQTGSGKYSFSAGHNANIVIHLVHKKIDVNPENPGKDPVDSANPEGPKNEDYYKDTHKTVKETIHYVYKNGKLAAQNHTDMVKFIRIVTIDEVTGKIVAYGDWQAVGNDSSFDAVMSPTIAGYVASEKIIGAITVNENSKNVKKTVTYTAKEMITSPINQIKNPPMLANDSTKKATISTSEESIKPQKITKPNSNQVQKNDHKTAKKILPRTNEANDVNMIVRIFGIISMLMSLFGITGWVMRRKNKVE